MKVAAAVLTYEPVTNGRLTLLQAAMASLLEADAVYLIHNGHGNTDELRERWPNLVANPDQNTTCGHGTNLCARVLAGTDADLCVHSDDDILWRPGWRAQLEDWWVNAPDTVALTGCHLEPDYPWNTILGTATYGDTTGLIRNSTGAGTWTYRAADRAAIFPIPQRTQGVGDVPACHRLIRNRRLIGQLDLADHVGETSTWGNRTVELHGTDIEPVRQLLATS